MWSLHRDWPPPDSSPSGGTRVCSPGRPGPLPCAHCPPCDDTLVSGHAAEPGSSSYYCLTHGLSTVNPKETQKKKHSFLAEKPFLMV